MHGWSPEARQWPHLAGNIINLFLFYARCQSFSVTVLESSKNTEYYPMNQINIIFWQCSSGISFLVVTCKWTMISTYYKTVKQYRSLLCVMLL